VIGDMSINRGSKRKGFGLVGCVALLIGASILAFALLMETENSAGKCIGLSEWETRDTTVTYRPHTGNIVAGLIGIETIILPAYVALEILWCPVEASDG
jgi:hypothetical protein